MLTRNKPAISPPPLSPPRSPSRATLFDLLISPLSFSLRLRFLFLSPSSFPLPLSFSYRGVSTRILVNTAGSSFHVESSNASRGYNNWFGASLARFDTRVPFCLAASTCVGRFLAYSLTRSLASLHSNARSRATSVCVSIPKLRVHETTARSRACFSRASFHFIYPSLSERFLALNIFTQKNPSKITLKYIFERLN